MNRLLIFIAVMVATVATSPAGLSQTQTEARDQNPSPVAPPQARWLASENLHATMNDVANLLRSAGANVPVNQPTPEQLDALANGLERHIARISADDTRPDPAKKALTLIIGEFRDSVDLMRNASHLAARRLGYLMAVRTADNYGKEFEHVDWEPLAGN